MYAGTGNSCNSVAVDIAICSSFACGRYKLVWAGEGGCDLKEYVCEHSAGGMLISLFTYITNGKEQPLQQD